MSTEMLRIIASLLKQINNKSEIENSMQNVNPNIKHTFEECCKFCFDHNLTFEASYFFKIDSVADFLHDELNTGHWSEVPITTRHCFSAVSFIKSLTVLKNPDKSPTDALEDALKCIDMGLLLGAPLNENHDLLTQCASLLTKELNQLRPQAQVEPLVEVKGRKRKNFSQYQEVYEALKGKEIVTLQCPSIEAFNKTCFHPQVPAKLQDCITHWPASKKWLDVNYLLEIAGDRTVPVEIGSRYTDENWTQKLMSLKDFIGRHYSESADEIGYLAQHNLFDQITELKDDICIPEYCALSRDYDNSSDPDINAWFGPKGTVSPIHFDPKDNLLAQVFGSKQILLYSPSDSECLYPHDDKLLFNTAQVDPIHPDLIKYPKYSQGSPYKCLLEAGEMLYIPVKWWHHVTALDKSFSVSFWWQ